MGKIHNYFDKLKNGTKVMFKEFFNRKTYKKQIANMLTFSRIIFAPAVVILIALGFPLAAIITAITGEITDLLDGLIARKTHTTSEYGALLDPILDKYYNIMLALSVAIINPLFLSIIFFEGFISASNMYFESKYKGLKIKSTQIGRIKQWPLSISIILGFVSILNPQFIQFANFSLLPTIIFQTAAFSSYAKTKEKYIANLNDNSSNNIVKDDKLVSGEEKTLTKSYEINAINSKKQEYERLRNLLLEISNSYNNTDEQTKSFQKIKK